jgi:hypothetical protein
MAPHRLSPPGTGAVFLGSQQHRCQVEAVSRRDAVLRAPVDVPTLTFARIHLHSADDGLLDLDAIIRPHDGPTGAGEGFLLLADFVEPPPRYLLALDRLAASLAKPAKAPTSTRPPLAKTPTPRPPLAKTPTSPPPTPTPTPRQETPTSSSPRSERPRARGDALAAVDTDPSAMLDLYRKALASDKKEAKPEASGSLWDKLKRVANKKL